MGDFWRREWLRFEEAMLVAEERERRRMPRFKRRWVLYHLLIVIVVLYYLFRRDVIVPVLFGLYLAFEASQAWDELRIRRKARSTGQGSDPR